MAFGHSHSSLDRHQRAVGIFPNRQLTEKALYDLRNSGFPMHRVSVITRDTRGNDDIAGVDVQSAVHKERVGNKADEGAAIGALTGGALGGLTGLLVGLGTLAIPGIGPVMLAGATATALATTLAGGAIGLVAGSLVGALIGLGIPEEQARIYSDRIAQGGYLVIVEGNDDEIARAEHILRRWQIEDYGIYASPAVANSPTLYEEHNQEVSRLERAVGIFSNRRDAEYAIADLRNAGFPLNHLSLVAHQFDRREPFTAIDLRDRFDADRYAIPMEQADYYNGRLSRGDDLVIVSGAEVDIRRAAAILGSHGVRYWQVYEPIASASPRQIVHSTGVSHPVEVSHSTEAVHLPIEAAHSLEASQPLEAARPPKVLHPLKVTHHSKISHSNVSHTAQADTVESHTINTHPVEAHQVSPVVAHDIASRITPIPASTHRTQQAIGVFSTSQEAKSAIASLHRSGFPLNHVALVNRQLKQRKPFAGMELHNHFDAVRFGVPTEYVRDYRDRFERGEYLVIVRGAEHEIRDAAAILNSHRIHNWVVYDASGVASTSHSTHSVHLAPDDRVRSDTQVISRQPEVIIIDRRHEPR